MLKMHILSSGLHSLQQLVIIKEIRHLLWKLEEFSHIKFCYVVEFTGCYGSHRQTKQTQHVDGSEREHDSRGRGLWRTNRSRVTARCATLATLSNFLFINTDPYLTLLSSTRSTCIVENKKMDVAQGNKMHGRFNIYHDRDTRKSFLEYNVGGHQVVSGRRWHSECLLKHERNFNRDVRRRVKKLKEEQICWVFDKEPMSFT